MSLRAKETPARGTTSLAIIFAAALVTFGGYYEWISAGIGIALILYLCYLKKRVGSLMCPEGISFISLCLLPVFAAITLLYAVDRGEALLGVIKFSSIPIFAIASAQLKESGKEKLLGLLPSMASAMTILAAICSVTPAKEFFFQADRLGGPFQYPNTYGTFLLGAIAVLCSKDDWSRKESLYFFICFAGMLMTGSRSIMILLAGYMAYSMVKKKALRKVIISICSIGAAGAALIVFLTGNVQGFGRLLTMGTENSTFWGRLLYARDAVFMLKDFPLGMGYRGYYFTQGSFQTGNYAVMYVHNELLQCALDFGILCAALIGAGILYSIFSKRITSMQRTILILITLHSLFDFDLQFLAMDMILILCMDLGKPRMVKRFYLAGVPFMIVLALQVYGLSFLGLQAAGKTQAAIKVYPGLTLSQAELMQKSENVTERERLADQILARNDYCAAAYKIKAETAAGAKDFFKMEQYARKAIQRDLYNEMAYEDYLRDISVAMDYYVRSGNEGTALKFLQFAVGVDELMQQAESKASFLAFKIRDTPVIELSEEYSSYLSQMKNLWEKMKT